MKKILLIAVAAFGMLMTACSKDEVAQPVVEKSTVTFTVEAPMMATRALGDGTTAVDLSWAVYAEDGTYLEALSGSKAGAFSSLKANVEIDLVNGKKYSVIFWAQAPGAPYTFDKAAKTVTVADALTSNKEAYDAFYKYETIAEVAGPRTQTIVLTRPFAQLNIATADTAKAADGGLVVKQTKVVVPAYKTLNLVDGSVADEVERTYAMADILTGEKITVGGKTYDLLSMNYLLVNAKELETVKFTVKNEGFEEEFTYNNVPLQRNYKTNIIGNLLTSTYDFTIEILPTFADEEHDVITDASALEELLNQGGTVTLDADYVLDRPITIAADLTLNFNGKTISGEFAKGTGAIINVKDGVTVTFVGGTLKNDAVNGDAIINNKGNLTLDGTTVTGAPIGTEGYPSYATYNYGVLVVEEGTTISSDRGAIYMNNGSDVTINGGNISVTDALGSRVLTAHVIYAYGYNSKLTINDGDFALNYAAAKNTGASVICPAGATISVYDGNFTYAGTTGGQSGIFQNYMGFGVPVKVYGGTYNDTTVNKNLAKGYTTSDNGNGTWSVISYASILEAQINQGGTITLQDNWDIAEPIVVAEGVTATIDLNGKELVGLAPKSVGAVLKNEGTLTITGGTISSTAANGGSAIQNNGTLTVENATLNGAPNAGGSWPSYAVNNVGTMTVNDVKIASTHGAVCSYADGAVVTLNDCEIDMAGIPGFTSHGIYTYNSGKVIVNGGTYANKATDQNASGASVINGAVEVNDGTFSGRIENYYGTPVLKGGTYSVKPNAAWVATGYKAYQTGDVWIVKKVVDADLSSNLENCAIVLPSGDNGTVTVTSLKDVVIEGTAGSTMIFKTDANTVIENVTLKNVEFKYTGGTVDCGVVINENAQIDNLVLEGCTITGTGAKAGRGISGKNDNASIVVKNCTFKDLGYPVYAWGGYESLTIEGCTFDNIKSWAIMPQSGFNGDLTVTGCTFKNCLGGGLIKAGTLTTGHTFTFTNNTITGCTVAGDHNWFQFNASAGTTIISNNTKDGQPWTPGVADGLK